MHIKRSKILFFLFSFLLIFTITTLINGCNCAKPIHHLMDQLGFDPSSTSHSFTKFASPNFQTKKLQLEFANSKDHQLKTLLT